MSQKSIQQSVEWRVVLVTGPKKWAKSEYNPRSNEAPPQSIDSAIAMSNIWLITGSSRGLGRVLTEVVLEAGHPVAAIARQPEQLPDLKLFCLLPNLIRTAKILTSWVWVATSSTLGSERRRKWVMPRDIGTTCMAGSWPSVRDRTTAR
jgi:hypothetical protein